MLLMICGTMDKVESKVTPMFRALGDGVIRSEPNEEQEECVVDYASKRGLGIQSCLYLISVYSMSSSYQCQLPGSLLICGKHRTTLFFFVVTTRLTY